MEYTEYSYLFPPRPEKAIMPDMLGFYERKGYVCQTKMNGTCNVLAVSPDRSIVAMNRHKEEHKLWTPTDETVADFVKLPGKGWYVFVAELLHSKVPGLRNINYVHDILVADGTLLVGETFSARQDRLAALLLKGKKGKAREMLTHWELSPTLWLAKNFHGDFRTIFDKMVRPEQEGLVLKNPNAPLTTCLRQTDNSAWQVKVRRPHKNYSF